MSEYRQFTSRLGCNVRIMQADQFGPGSMMLSLDFDSRHAEVLLSPEDLDSLVIGISNLSYE